MKNYLSLLPALLLSGLIITASCHREASPVKVLSLTCENQVDPEGISITRPHLSWMAESPERGERQTAYQVLVASTPEILAADEGDLWNSGHQKSDQSCDGELCRA